MKYKVYIGGKGLKGNNPRPLTMKHQKCFDVIFELEYVSDNNSGGTQNVQNVNNGCKLNGKLIL